MKGCALPVLPVLAILISLYFVIQYKWEIYATFAAAIAVGVVLDYFFDKNPRKKLSPSEQKKLFEH